MSSFDLPPGCILRPAQAADQSAIRALVRAARLDSTQLRWPQFWVIAHAGRVVACGQLRRFHAWRGRGLSAVLVRRLVAEATLPLFLECRAALVPYYARFGFVSIRWHAAPGPLRVKFGLSQIVSRLFRAPVAMMRHAPDRQERKARV